MPRDQASMSSGLFTLVVEPIAEPADGAWKALASPVGDFRASGG